jgi:hypothetical protein
MKQTVKALLIDQKGFTYTIDVEDPPPRIAEWAYIKRNPFNRCDLIKSDMPVEGAAVVKVLFELESYQYRVAVYSEILK